MVFAVAAETASLVALALMERRILILAGLQLRPGRAIEIAYARNALSQSLPVIGSAAASASLAAVWTLTRVQRLVRRPAGDPASLVASTMTGLAQFHLNRSDISRIVWSAFRNWGFDLLCLALSIKAAGVQVPWWGIVLAWAAGAAGASLNLTPGGLGVVEAALTGALVGLGVPGAPALTAVLLYRGITFWLAIAIGWPLYWRLRRDRALTADPPPAGKSRWGRTTRKK